MNKKDTLALLEEFKSKINLLIEETKKNYTDGDDDDDLNDATGEVAIKEKINSSDFTCDIVRIVNDSVCKIIEKIPADEQTKVKKKKTPVESMKEIANSFVVGTKDKIKATESELFDTVLTYRDNIGLMYETVYCDGVCKLEEKVAQSEQFYRERCGQYPDDKLSKLLESLNNSIRNQKNRLEGFSTKQQYRFTFSKGFKKNYFESERNGFLRGVTDLDNKMNAVTDKIEEIKAAEEERKRKEEEARRQAEEEARIKREEAARPGIEKIVSGFVRVKPSLDPDVNPAETPSYCHLVGRDNGKIYTKYLENSPFEHTADTQLEDSASELPQTKSEPVTATGEPLENMLSEQPETSTTEPSESNETAQLENLAIVPLYKLVAELVTLASPKGYDPIGFLRNNGVITKDTKGIIVVDTGHTIELNPTDTRALLTNYTLYLSEKVIFTKNAGEKFKKLIKP